MEYKEVLVVMRRVVAIIGVLVILIGVCALGYYPLSSYLNSRQHLRTIDDYNEVVEHIDNDVYENLLKEAHEYNDMIFSRAHHITTLDDAQLEEYHNLLASSVTGLIGYLNIPKLNLNEPIYHGTSDETLLRGIGHLAGSSLPVGGLNTRAVLTGHSGLRNAELFTKLDQLNVGDVFTVTVLKETVTYEVFDIQTVLPREANELPMYADQDLVTLVTCTPYGINSHRLLVTGKRIPNIEKEEDIPIVVTEETKEVNEGVKRIIVNVTMEIIALLSLFALIEILAKKKKQRKDEKGE